VARGKLEEAAVIFDEKIPVTESNLGIERWLFEDHVLQTEAPTILVFWESFCPWCQLYIPRLNEARRKAGTSVQVIGLTTLSGDEEKSVDFVRRNHFDFPQAVYEEDVAKEAVGGIYLPLTIALCEGKVVWQGNAS